jgi:hypothetical protein
MGSLDREFSRAEKVARERHAKMMGKPSKKGKKKRKRVVKQKKITEVTYTLAQRTPILMSMTEAQRQVYADSIQLTFSDRVMNLVFEDAPKWRFTGIRVDYGWDYRKTNPKRSAHLKCVCGRPLRYQYELISNDGRNFQINLGSSHFMQHLGIPTSVAKEVFGKFNQVQRTMDEMLARYKQGERFPKNYRQLALSDAFAKSDSVVKRRLHEYAVVDLPLMQRDKKLLKNLTNNNGSLQGGQPKHQNSQSSTNSESVAKSKKTKKQKNNQRRHGDPSKAVAMTMAELQGKTRFEVTTVRRLEPETRIPVQDVEKNLPRPHAEV